LKYTLTYPEHREKEKNLEILDIAWNKQGNVVAASLGHLQHETFDEEKTFIHCWNISQSHDHPVVTLECNTTIMSLAFHPNNLNILAGGGFNGQLFLWDISKKDSLLYQS